MKCPKCKCKVDLACADPQVTDEGDEVYWDTYCDPDFEGCGYQGRFYKDVVGGRWEEVPDADRHVP